MMNDYYDMGDDYSGNWGVDYGDASGADYTGYDFGDYGVGESGDWGMDYSGAQDYTFDPDAYLASQGGYAPPSDPGLWEQLQGMPAAAGAAFMKKMSANPVGSLAALLSGGSQLYGSIQANKQREAAARQIRDAKDKREATLARYGAVMPLKMERAMLPQGDLLRAGERSGGNQWFTPTQFRPMAKGGVVKPSWIDALFAGKPAPAVVGSGAAAAAGEALQNRNYQLYLQMQEMDGGKSLPYDVWAQLQQQGRGMAGGGALSNIGEELGDGTSDDIPISASEGEYVIDAESVSALGNGSNEAGARVLDQMLESLRAHRRNAPNNEIPPDAKPPEAYMQGGT